MVSSTTPRFGPRWPPVLETASTRKSRISAARRFSWSWLSSLMSSGPLMRSSKVTAGCSSCGYAMDYPIVRPMIAQVPDACRVNRHACRALRVSSLPRFPRDTGDMVRIGAVVMNVTDARRASQFWSRALGYAYRDGEFSADDKTHLDLYTDSALEQRTEVERLISLGATAVDWTYPRAPGSSCWPTRKAIFSASSTPDATSPMGGGVRRDRRMVMSPARQGRGRRASPSRWRASLATRWCGRTGSRRRCTTRSGRQNRTGHGRYGSAARRWNCCGRWRRSPTRW